MWVRSFSTRLTSVTFAEDKVLIFLITGSTVVLTCCKGDCQSQWKTPIFGPPQLGNPLTDFSTAARFVRAHLEFCTPRGQTQ